MHRSDHRRRGQTDHLLEAPELNKCLHKPSTGGDERLPVQYTALYWTTLAKYPADVLTQLSDSEHTRVL